MNERAKRHSWQVGWRATLKDLRRSLSRDKRDQSSELLPTSPPPVSTRHRITITARPRHHVSVAVSKALLFYVHASNQQCRQYRASAPKTRLLLGVGLIAWGAIGLYTTDTAEKAFDMVPSEEDKKKLDQSIPKIRVVEKE